MIILIEMANCRGASVITSILVRGRGRQECQGDRNMSREAEFGVKQPIYKPRSVRGLWKLEKPGSGFSLGPPEGMQP